MRTHHSALRQQPYSVRRRGISARTPALPAAGHRQAFLPTHTPVTMVACCRVVAAVTGRSPRRSCVAYGVEMVFAARLARLNPEALYASRLSLMRHS